jgi:magnesium transporter
VLTCRLYRKGELEEEGVPPDRIHTLLDEPGALLWVDAEDPSDEDLGKLQRDFGFHPLAIEDTQHRNQRPKIEVYDDYFFMVMYGISLDDGELREREIHAFVGQGYLVTLRYAPAFDLSPAQRRWERHTKLTAEGGGFLLYALVDEVVDAYFDIVEHFEDDAEEIEDEVFADEVDPDLQKKIFDLKKRLVEFRRRVMPLREVLDLLQDEGGVVTPALRAYYRDVEDHVLRILEFVDSVRDLLTTALEAHLSQVSNRLNQVMKQVTSWAAIILVPTLIAGIYGMNFVGPFPDFDHPAGFWVAIGLMVVSGGILFGVFRRRGWI